VVELQTIIIHIGSWGDMQISRCILVLVLGLKSVDAFLYFGLQFRVDHLRCSLNCEYMGSPFSFPKHGSMLLRSYLS
jgi:hypothetical protein